MHAITNPISTIETGTTLTDAAHRLGISIRQATRLVQCGALGLAGQAQPVEETVPSAIVHVDVTRGTLIDHESLERLEAFEFLTGADLPVRTTDGAISPTISVHAGPVELVNNDPWRPAAGVDWLNRHGLSTTERLRAWVGYWPISKWAANLLAEDGGGLLVADVSGFLFPDVFAIRVTGYDRVPTEWGTRTRLHGVPLDPAEAAMLRGKRIVNERGAIWQWVYYPD